ncbi:carboxypeptidase regulatory-like domain-containing protein [Geomonas anaerohicana]|uniref:Carboxypeptidase regulatory-like domain-containing protein n=1 Tax=Geomonas anaerohicana TaxID=2798583 RepID=A0ABS0Y9D5_9BACT|nr:carboxypeptidase regulatory-like domain-containing protein [Geomonas anaerohicana]MBJ6748902.1 carboxypeptidase regulatory-like domain-containing protein [Geomonas anaerohicana]
MKNLFSLLIFLTSLVVIQSPASAGPYKIVDLGPMTTPVRINNKSVVVGYKTTSDGHHTAFYYSRGITKDLGTFNGTDSEALDVNSSGQIVGTFKQNGARRGFRLTGSGFTDLFATSGLTQAVGVNDSGTILGSAGDYPVLLQNGVVKDISGGVGYPGQAPYTPTALNNLGQATFYQNMCAAWECEASYLYASGTWKELPFTPLDLNNRSEMIGHVSEDMNGVIYRNGIATVIGAGWEYAYPDALNDLGQVVGSGYEGGGYHQVPFLYQGGSMVNINTLLPASSGWSLQDVPDSQLDINNYGQIVGRGRLNGEVRGFLLSPTYSVSGTVRSGSATGPAVPGVTVSIAGSTAVTSSAGTFYVSGILPGTYTVTISKTGYVTRTAQLVVDRDLTGLVFYFPNAFSISGIVHAGSSTGPVLPGASVSIAGKSAVTSSTGTFSITGIVAGTYTLTISKVGYVTKTYTGYVVNGNKSGLVFYLTPAPTYYISGTVRQGSTTGPLLAGATVAIAGKSAVTGSTGTFSISGILAGTYTVTITKAGYATRTVTGFTVSSNRTGLVFYLVPLPTYTVSGTVRSGSSTGPILPGATVAVAGKSAVTGSTGTFSISGILAGTYTVTISKAGYATRSMTGFVVSGNRTGLVFYLTPLPTYTISGTVRRGSATGTVLPGATVSIAGKSAITGTAGTFSISGILAGTYTLTISKTGYVTKTYTGYVISSNRTGLVFYLVPATSASVTRPAPRAALSAPEYKLRC